MPYWILTILLVLISGLAGVMIGFVVGCDNEYAKTWRESNDEQR